MSKILITGGYGFIGSNLIAQWLRRNPNDKIINVDCATYAARPQFLDRFIRRNGKKHKSGFVADYDYIWENVDIRDLEAVEDLFFEYEPDHVIHLAAESHVCKSIKGPGDFMSTNIMGTFNLIETFRKFHGDSKSHRFHHVSTDEVYGSLGPSDPKFDEDTSYKPTSPYSASKASSNHIVNAYNHTYGVNTVVTCSSNNFGPNQHNEKLIPKCINSLLYGEKIQLYGTGEQVRDWIFVEDHCEAIQSVFSLGASGGVYNIGGDMELTNLAVVEEVIRAMCVAKSMPQKYEIEHINARPTDDRRYAIDNSKMRSLGWRPNKKRFQENLVNTVKWYMENKDV